jgi:hypothetical protein
MPSGSCPARLGLGFSTSQRRNGFSATATSSPIADLRCNQCIQPSGWPGDTQTGNLQAIQTAANDEVGSPLRLRIESGPVMDFPGGSVVGRADFFFTTGVGIASGHDP